VVVIQQQYAPQYLHNAVVIQQQYAPQYLHNAVVIQQQGLEPLQQWEAIQLANIIV
jgi:hypothetical protein